MILLRAKRNLKLLVSRPVMLPALDLDPVVASGCSVDALAMLRLGIFFRAVYVHPSQNNMGDALGAAGLTITMSW